MKSILAVARQTLSQCFRMKIALAVFVILALSLILLPGFLTGDGTLSGQIRSLISYGMGITTLLLSLVTIVVTVAIVTEDVRQKTVVLLVVKPLPRWQYILGRWLGIVFLDAILCAVSLGGLYLGIYYLRDGIPASPSDRTAIETEIFTARKSYYPKKPDFKKMAFAKLEKLKKNKVQYIALLERYRNEPSRSNLSPEERLFNDEFIKIKNSYQDRRYGGAFVWEFDDIKSDTTVTTDNIELAVVDSNGIYTFKASNKILGACAEFLPVRIEGVEVYITRVYANAFSVLFSKNQLMLPQIQKLKKGSLAKIKISPVYQLRFKIQYLETGGIPEMVKPSAVSYAIGWGGYKKELRNGKEVLVRDRMLLGNKTGEAKTSGYSTVNIIPDSAIAESKMWVEYLHLSHKIDSKTVNSTIRIDYYDVELRVRAGGFGMNYFKGSLLIFAQLIFLAALGIFFSSFLSFPVSMIACSVLLIGGLLFNWLGDGAAIASHSGDSVILNSISQMVLYLINLFMPNLSNLTPSDKLTDGQYISWQDILSSAGLGATLRSALYLGLGCIIFHKRELSKVQV